MTRPRPTDVAVVELGGRGGIFEHAVFVAREVAARGYTVAMHSADLAEGDLGPANLCRCAPLRDRAPRLPRVMLALKLLSKTVPHLFRSFRRASVTHLHGTLRLPLTILILTLARVGGSRVIYSPHNLFVRNGGRFATRVLHLALRLAHEVIVYSAADVSSLHGTGLHVHQVDLLHSSTAFEPDEHLVSQWGERLGPRPVVLLPGFIRADKNPELFVRAISDLDGVSGWVIGEDHGAANAARAAAARHGDRVRVLETRLDHEEFVALLSAADLVVCPYAVASQTGVLSIARDLGVRTLASSVGGLPELADAVFDPIDAESLAAAVRRSLDQHHQIERPTRSIKATVDQLVEIFGLAPPRISAGADARPPRT